MKVELSEQFVAAVKEWAKNYIGSESDKSNAVSHLNQIIVTIENQEVVDREELENHIEELIGGIN